jgi:hypothetical protein
VPAVVGSASGAVTIIDNAGTQTVGLTVRGSGPPDSPRPDPRNHLFDLSDD